jgi:hypothetical protein
MIGRQTRLSSSVASPNPNSPSNLNSKSCSLSDSTPVLNSIRDSRSKAHSSSDPSSTAGTRSTVETGSNAGTRPHSGMASGNDLAAAGFNREPTGANHSAVERHGGNRFAAERSGASSSGTWGDDERAGEHRGGRAVEARASYGFRARDKAEIVAGELLVGRGPVCGPVRIKPEALERIRRRNAARNGSRSP